MTSKVTGSRIQAVCADSRAFINTFVKPNSIDLIIFDPPFLGSSKEYNDVKDIVDQDELCYRRYIEQFANPFLNSLNSDGLLVSRYDRKSGVIINRVLNSVFGRQNYLESYYLELVNGRSARLGDHRIVHEISVYAKNRTKKKLVQGSKHLKSDEKKTQYRGSLPTDIAKFILGKYTKPGSKILDPTAGSFTIADVLGEFPKRNLIAIESDPLVFKRYSHKAST